MTVLVSRWGLVLALFISAFATLGVAQAQPERGTLRIAQPVEWGGSESLDPYSEFRLYDANARLYNRLVQPGADGAPAPELATSWAANDDSTEWTLQLREGVRFHDGSDMTAADVAYTLNRVIDPEFDTPVKAVLGIMESVEAIDESSVLIRLSSPHADFPLLLTDYRVQIIPEGSGDTIGATGIGTGPFKLETFDVDGTTVLAANDDYWEGTPKLASVELVPIPDQQAVLQAMLAGQIDFFPASSSEADLFTDESKFALRVLPSGGWEAFVMRTDTAPFDDVRVRRALRLVVDRQEMIDLVLGPDGGTVACDTPVWPGDQYYADLACTQDIETARALLAEAGYPDGIQVDLFVSDLSQDWLPMAEVYQQQAAEAGIEVNIIQTPSDGYYSDVWMVEPFTATAWGERQADQILNEAYRGGADWNETFWNDPEFDALLDRARSESDAEARSELYHEIQQTIWEDGGSLIPFFVNSVDVWSSAVQGIPDVPYNEIPWHEVSVTR